MNDTFDSDKKIFNIDPVLIEIRRSMDSEEIDSIVEEAAANHNENGYEKWSDEEIERLKKEIKELGIIDISD